MVSGRASAALGAGLLLAQRTGCPIWEDPSLIAEDNTRLRIQRVRCAPVSGSPDAAARSGRFVHHDGARGRFLLPVEGTRLPVNVDPLDSKLDDPVERAGLARVFEEGLGKTVGYVLPLRRMLSYFGRAVLVEPAVVTGVAAAVSGPGDSPMGYRLPLDSLPWTKPEDVEWSFDPDPFQQRDKLPEKPARKRSDFRSDFPNRGTLWVRKASGNVNGSKAAGEGRIVSVGVASRALRAGARRKALYLHAAGRVSGGLSRSDCGYRRHCRVHAECPWRSKATRRHTIRASLCSK